MRDTCAWDFAGSSLCVQTDRTLDGRDTYSTLFCFQPFLCLGAKVGTSGGLVSWHGAGLGVVRVGLDDGPISARSSVPQAPGRFTHTCFGEQNVDEERRAVSRSQPARSHIGQERFSIDPVKIRVMPGKPQGYQVGDEVAVIRDRRPGLGRHVDEGPIAQPLHAHNFAANIGRQLSRAVAAAASLKA